MPHFAEKRAGGKMAMSIKKKLYYGQETKAIPAEKTNVLSKEIVICIPIILTEVMQKFQFYVSISIPNWSPLDKL